MSRWVTRHDASVAGMVYFAKAAVCARDASTCMISSRPCKNLSRRERFTSIRTIKLVTTSSV